MRADWILVAHCLVAAAVAAPAAAQSAAGAPASVVSARVMTQWIGAALFVHPSETTINSGNAVLAVPQATALGEFRANARFEFGSRLQVVVRPRVRGTLEATWLDARPARRQMDGTFEMTEAYVHWRPVDALSVTYGLQNFQWGPAEFMGPSNRLFHEVGVFRDALYSVRGKHVARVNLSSGRQWSFVALAELSDNGEAPFRAGAPFRRAGQAKLEYTTASGAAYVGVTAGGRGGERPWTGGYASVSVTDRVSMYADGAVQRGGQAWYPVSAAGRPIAFMTDARSSGARVLALAGLRYSTDSAVDARVEYLRQDAGYTRAQVTDASLVLAQSLSPENVARWSAPGLEFLGRDLVLASVLARELPPARHLDVQGRYVRSLTDGSGAIFVTASLAASDALVLFDSVTLTHGPALTEFTRLAGVGAVAGFIWSW